MLFTIFYILSLFLLLLVVLRVNKYGILNNSLVFYLLTSYLLNIASIIFYYHFNDWLFALISVISLILFSIGLIINLRKVIGYIPLKCIPYIISIVYLTLVISLSL